MVNILKPVIYECNVLICKYIPTGQPLRGGILTEIRCSIVQKMPFCQSRIIEGVTCTNKEL